jgi:ubiquinone/menaquinone biosynthesis C-methylase UbiE
MEKLDIHFTDVQEVYDGWEGRLWELLMGEQIHIGGFAESMVMANQAEIKEGQKVLDLCSGLGGGVRFLVNNFNVRAYGLEGSEHMIKEAQKRTQAERLADRIEYKQGDVTSIPWEDNTFDVVWGEDAWCYIHSKETLIKEAARVLKPGGKIAFSDWVTGPKGLSENEAKRINTFMTFPYTESLKGYQKLVEESGFTVKYADDLCELFAECCELYYKMLTMQHKFDALKILGNDKSLFEKVCVEMKYMAEMGRQGKFGRGRIVAVLGN